MIVEEEDYLAHFGILRKSGRYPWGSGDTPHQRRQSFFDTIADLRAQGLTDTEIAKGLDMSLNDLRSTNTIAVNQRRAAQIAEATALKDKGYSNIAIGKKMDINESSVRSLLAPGAKDRADILSSTVSMLREHVDEKGYLDVGKGVENQLRISKEKLATAIAVLKDEGYALHNIQVDTSTSNKTTVKVLARPGSTYADVNRNKAQIQQITAASDNGGRTYYGMLPPKSIDSGRIAIRYAEDGGSKEDGVMYIRPGVDDVSLGGARYAQVRVLVDGTHYLKGMAMYKDDLPEGVDVLFNTNKSSTGNKLDALKKITEDPDNPFGAVVDQIGRHDERGNVIELTSAMNVVNKEGDWDGWRKSISSQVLSKQSPVLAKQQLDLAYQRDKDELDTILKLTNPAIRKKLLKSYADSADSAAVELRAAHLPRQRSQVLLPLNSMKETEIYAPNYRDGERVALIRYPHGGTFEIPELTVNNRNPDAISLLGRAQDAVAINSAVAARLSGADFDGDAVLVIPNNTGMIKTSPALEGLKNFDPQREYPPYEGMARMTPDQKAYQMGMISNLITDMTIKKANTTELAQAVRHSMVVIDAEKWNLNYKESARRNGITNLQRKYQARDDGRFGGASTLISRASGSKRVPLRRPQRMADGGPVDAATGRKMWEYTGESYVDRKTGKTVLRTVKSTQLAETDDARTLLSKQGGTKIEAVYADHSNRMKALANRARKAEIATPNLVQSSTAKVVYAPQIKSLNAKLDKALQNSPRERQAQLLTDATVQTKLQANPNLDTAQIKKIRAQALAHNRVRMNARKELVEITDREWEAIQAGAISNNKLKGILDNTDIERVKELATPRATPVMGGADLARARAMANAGRTQSEIADALGVSLTTVKKGLG